MRICAATTRLLVVGALALLASATLGACGLEQAVVRAAPSVCSQPRKDGKSWTRLPLVSTGNQYLASGLSASSSDPSAAADTSGGVRYALTCFTRAARLSPDDYGANLGAGIAHLAMAKAADEGSLERKSHVMASRRYLGRAYIQRQGPYEVLYYIAELARADEETTLANELVDELIKAGVKLAPALVLKADMHEDNEQDAEAGKLYQQALGAGWPFESVEYARERLDAGVGGY